MHAPLVWSCPVPSAARVRDITAHFVQECPTAIASQTHADDVFWLMLGCTFLRHLDRLVKMALLLTPSSSSATIIPVEMSEYSLQFYNREDIENYFVGPNTPDLRQPAEPFHSAWDSIYGLIRSVQVKSIRPASSTCDFWLSFLGLQAAGPAGGPRATVASQPAAGSAIHTGGGGPSGGRNPPQSVRPQLPA